jgi:hypothetical protein
MSDDEIRSVLTILLQEWRRRRFADEFEGEARAASWH